MSLKNMFVKLLSYHPEANDVNILALENCDIPS